MIIGITGSFGSGKGTVAEYLVDQKGFQHYSARSLIAEEVKKRSMSLNRDSMIVVANDLRAQYGPTYIFKRLIDQAKDNGRDAVVESVRAVAEVDYTKTQGGVVLGVDADPELRYQRIISRQSETDQVSFEKWQQQEEAESNSGDETKQDIFGALKKSDYIIKNESDLATLHKKIDEFLSTIAKR